MRLKVLFCLLPILIASCTKEVKTKDSLLQHLPPNPSLVIKINNLTNFRSELKNNTFLKDVEQLSHLNDILSKVKGLEHLSTDKTTALGIYEVGKGHYDYVLVAKNNADLFNVDSIAIKL